MKGICIVFLALFAMTEITSASCPASWSLSKNSKKCYFIGAGQQLKSFFELATFCAGQGGKIVEPDSVDELNEVQAFILSSLSKFKNGPYFNYVAPFNDRFIVASTFEELKDAGLAAKFAAVKLSSGSSRQCIGFGIKGNTLNLETDNCLVNNTPLCEKSAS